MSKSVRPRSGVTRSYRRLVTALALSSFLLVLLLQVVPRFSRTVYAAGDVSLNTLFVAVTQNFDSLATTGTANTWTDGTTLTGWYSQFTATPSNPTTYRASTGTDTTGAIYSFGVAGTNAVTERAFGSVASGTPGDIYYAIKLTNNTGSTITALNISYTGEQWRQGGCTPTPCTPAAQTLDFQYQVANAGTITDANTPTTGWTDFNSLDFTTPQPGTSTAAAIDGNAAANRTAKSAMLVVTVNNGQEVWLRWKDSNDANNDHGVAIDDFSVTPIGGPIATNGVRTTDIQGTDDGGYALALQPDGKIVVGGYSVNIATLNKDFALVRYNYDGTLDTTFGGGTGKVTTDFNGTSDRIWGITLQSDGKIVAVGETVSLAFPGTNDIAIARYTTAGVLDTTFGGTGKVTTDHGGGANNAAYAVAMSGTNIIVAGYETVSGNNDFMIARYTTAGVLDPTFGTLGVTTQGFSGFNDVARAVAIDSSGNIVVGGYARSGGGDDDFAIARFTSGGVLDTTFVAGAGKAAINIFSGSSADQAFGLAITPTGAPNAGTIVLAGSAYNPINGNKDFALVRYTSAGALDTTQFGGGTGIVTTNFSGSSSDVANAVYVRSDGFIVAGGFSRSSASSDDFAIARYTANGSLDSTLDGDGKLTLRISNDDERIYGIAREFDGKIVAAGFATTASSNPVQHDFALARFNADGSLDATNATALNNPDLLVTITGPDDPNSVVAGDSFSWTVTVTNRGPVSATNVVLTDTLPSGVTYVGSTASNGTANQSGGVVTDNVGTLASGATATLTINVMAGNTPMLVADTATATLAETDASPPNNTATEYTRIIGVYDLSFSPSTVTGGCQNSTGTVTLTGPAPGNGVMVNISSTSPAVASAPAQVLVPGGATSAQFTVTTYTVQANTTARFEATLGPTSFVRRLVVNAGVCN
jgi:uncharacterized delta-60 repeat protein/uncharacterized repeat protein (TIGR01451 family)